MLEDKVLLSNMAANIDPTPILPLCCKKSSCHKTSSLNDFALKFGMQDNFDVLCRFLTSPGSNSMQVAYSRRSARLGDAKALIIA